MAAVRWIGNLDLYYIGPVLRLEEMRGGQGKGWGQLGIAGLPKSCLAHTKEETALALHHIHKQWEPRKGAIMNYPAVENLNLLLTMGTTETLGAWIYPDWANNMKPFLSGSSRVVLAPYFHV